jgi:hypothetical protein
MVEKDLIVRCPGCGNGKVISMALGQLLQCDVCQTCFQAPVSEDVNADTTDGDQSVVGAQPAAPGPSQDDAASASPPPEAQGSATDRRGGRSSSRRAEDFNLAAGAGEPSDVPEAANSSDQTDSRQGPGWMWTVLSMVAVGVILTTVVTAVFLLLLYVVERARNRVAKLPPVAVADQADAHWTDASKFSQRIDPMVLKVERCVYGSLRAKDLSRQVITTEDDNLLGITVSARNSGRRPRDFQNWYGHVFESPNGEEEIANLTDDQGRPYSLLKFDDVSYIEGQRLADQIRPGQCVQDTLVFLVPQETERTEITYFRLVLPGEAVGISQNFCFQIPTDMIVGFVDAGGTGKEAGEMDPDVAFPVN